MMRKTVKLFLIFGMIICIIFSNGCFSVDDGKSNKDQSNSLDNQISDVTPNLWVDYYFEKNNSVLVDNKITVCVRPETPEAICDICLSIFVDNEEIPIEELKIPIDNLERFFEYIITDYDIHEYIKFILSYELGNPGYSQQITRELHVYGSFKDDDFIISEAYEIIGGFKVER